MTFRTNNSDRANSVPIGNNLPQFQDIPSRAIALEQNGANPAARVAYVALSHDLYKSSDGGDNFGSSILNTPTSIISLATSSADSNLIWVGTAVSASGDPVGNGMVHRSADGGSNWDTGPLVSAPGSGSVTAIAIDPANKSRVAIVYGGQSGIDSTFRTQRVFLTSDSGATWTDISGTDGAGPVGNLPDLPMHSLVFDTSTVPSAIIVANDAAVMRCTNVTISGSQVTATWKIYGAGLPNVSCMSLAIDNTVKPPVVRVGTYGRGCFELTRTKGPVIGVESLLGFAAMPVGKSAALPVYIYNTGDAPLTVTALTMTAGSSDFAVDPATVFPAAIAPGGTKTINIIFTPTGLGDRSAVFEVASNDAHSLIACRLPAEELPRRPPAWQHRRSAPLASER